MTNSKEGLIVKSQSSRLIDNVVDASSSNKPTCANIIVIPA